MISKKSTNECFVYIMLPSATESVTAGRLSLARDRHDIQLGQFVYAKSYLSRTDAVEIDPFELKLIEQSYKSARNGGIFSSLRDAGPDFWGRRVIEKHTGKTQLDELDYLLESPDDRAGALGFGLSQKPPAPKKKFNQTIELTRLQEIADALLREGTVEQDHVSIQVKDLLLLGTSMGGARPKTVVEDEQGLWIAKFARPDDRWNNPKVEHALLELARSCGINAARSRVEKIGAKDVLLVQRFDRQKTPEGYTRARMISGMTVLRADDSVLARDRWSYILLCEELRRIVAHPKKDAEELFRRICFNALVSNLDDHPRNHALVASDREWKLSPAYDLTPSPVISKERRDLAMSCGDGGRFANAKNILSQCARFLLKEDEARAILSQISEHVRATWHSMLRSQGVSVKDSESIRAAFEYEGFDY